MPSSPLKWLWLTLLIIVLDQLSKHLVSSTFLLYERRAIIDGVFNFTLLHNSGAAFSFLSDAGGWQRWFLSGLASIISLVLLVWLYRLPAGRNWLAAALALVLGGAVGNLCDRIRLGYVVDFLDFYYHQWHWPAFNVADAAISIGAVMLIIDTLWLDRAEVSTHDAAASRKH